MRYIKNIHDGVKTRLQINIYNTQCRPHKLEFTKAKKAAKEMKSFVSLITTAML